MLAILECMKKTRNRLKLMIGIATYLSLNLWIRGAMEFSLTLFIVGILDVKSSNYSNAGAAGIASTIFLIVFVALIGFMVFMIIKYFLKNQYPEKWPKGI